MGVYVVLVDPEKGVGESEVPGIMSWAQLEPDDVQLLF
jgi:hypothetical protein